MPAAPTSAKPNSSTNSTTLFSVASMIGRLVPAMAKPEQGALPQVLIAALSDGNIESMRHPRLDSFDDSPLALERMIFRNHQVELENTDNHGENGNRKGCA